MVSGPPRLTQSELSDDVKASINSLIEDKAPDPLPYDWILPPGLQLPDGPPTHRRMPRKVHHWSILELRKWKKALDNGEVKLQTANDLKEEAKKREKTSRREKKERARSASVKFEAKKKNMSVEVTVDSKFPRSKYQVLDLSGPDADVEIISVNKKKKTAISSKSSLAPDLMFRRNVRAESMNDRLDPKLNRIFSLVPGLDAPKFLNLDGPNKAYNLQYNFEDFFKSQTASPLLPPDAPPTPKNTPAKSNIRVEREALKAEFRQKIALIFGLPDDDFGSYTLTEEEWEKSIDTLAKRVQRHEVDLRGELDVLQTVCKQTHESYYKVTGTAPMPFTDSKVSESIEYVKGVFGDILYNGSGLAVEDALKAVKVRYQERLGKNEKEAKQDSCDCTVIYEEEVEKVRKDFQSSLARLEGDIQRYAEICSTKIKKRGIGKDESSLVKKGESGKLASKKAEIKELQGKVAELQQQLDQNIQNALAISEQEEVVKTQRALIEQHEAKIAEQAKEIETLRTQLERKKLERMLSAGTDIQSGASKTPNPSSATIARTSEPPQTSSAAIAAPATQKAPILPPNPVQVQRNQFLLSSPLSNQPLPPPPTSNTTSKRKRDRKRKRSMTSNPDAKVLPPGSVFKLLNPKGKKHDRESRVQKEPKKRAERNRTARSAFGEED